MVEHHVRNVGVESSNLFFSTKSQEKMRKTRPTASFFLQICFLFAKFTNCLLTTSSLRRFSSAYRSRVADSAGRPETTGRSRSGSTPYPTSTASRSGRCLSSASAATSRSAWSAWPSRPGSRRSSYAASDQVFGFDIIYAMKFKLALGFVFLSFAVCAAVRTVTDLPPSPYADTEVSSNVVFNATRGEGQMDNVKWRM